MLQWDAIQVLRRKSSVRPPEYLSTKDIFKETREGGFALASVETFIARIAIGFELPLRGGGDLLDKAIFGA
jgi:hypothetical protein